ncbi:hypothetical protein BHE74_00008046 [Ensete ventricosum]|nr:hypothetical protein GW17_00053923 [Ensete ventricosum]RWW83447.1 hypothetical protein BHE74_00008046 [Ensete ventricosum]
MQCGWSRHVWWATIIYRRAFVSFRPPAKACHGNFVEIPTVNVTPPAVHIEPGCRTRGTRRIDRRVTRPLHKLAASLSCYAAAVVVDGTAKVVLPDGGLREYKRPVTAAHALGKDAACFFVCDADAMEFDAFVSAVSAEHELRPGKLYFVLPRTMLKYPLRAEDVAALALKASDAFMGAAGRGAPAPLVFALEPEDATGSERRVQEEKGKRVKKSSAPRPLVFALEQEDATGSERRVQDEKGKRVKRAGGGSRKFTPDLSVIPE